MEPSDRGQRTLSLDDPADACGRVPLGEADTTHGQAEAKPDATCFLVPESSFVYRCHLDQYCPRDALSVDARAFAIRACRSGFLEDWPWPHSVRMGRMVTNSMGLLRFYLYVFGVAGQINLHRGGIELDRIQSSMLSRLDKRHRLGDEALRHTVNCTVRGTTYRGKRRSHSTRQAMETVWTN